MNPNSCPLENAVIFDVLCSMVLFFAEFTSWQGRNGSK